MPTPGLSLVGFLDRDAALLHLRQACVPQNDTDAVLEAEWLAAQAALGAPQANAGQPVIQDIPPSGHGHLQALTAQPWIADAFNGPLQGSTFKLIELAPLLAFQYTVDQHRSQHHCSTFSSPPTLDELLGVCLPINLPNEHFDFDLQQNSLIVRSRSLNLRSLIQGMFPQRDGTLAGIYFGSTVPLVHVVRYNGRCYLHNGFHRAFGAGLAGATHIPCVFRDVPDPNAVGIQANTFQLPQLEGPNPPTVRHFIEQRAHSVALRAMTRILHLSWSEYGLPAE